MISDEMLCIAAGEYEQALLASLPEADECDHSFSAKFEKKMRHLCHRVKYASTYSVMKRVACAIIAIVLCGSMLLMLNTEVRAAVIGWIKNTYNSFTSYFFVGEVNAPAARAYVLAGLPEEYVLLAQEETENSGSVIYADPEGSLLVFCYEFGPDAGAFFIKPEDHILIQETVDGQAMDFYLSQDPAYTSTVVWSVNDHVLLSITANCDKDALIRFTRCVVPVY